MDDRTSWRPAKHELLLKKLNIKDAETRLAFLKLLLAQLRSRVQWQGGHRAA
jgi:hypothetical protein